LRARHLNGNDTPAPLLDFKLGHTAQTSANLQKIRGREQQVWKLG